jgi:hypothetical protein
MRVFRKKDEKVLEEDKAIILFDTVKNGLLAEKVILKESLYVKKVAPPPEYRKGCEISVEIRRADQKVIEQLLIVKGIDHQGIINL